MRTTLALTALLFLAAADPRQPLKQPDGQVVRNIRLKKQAK
ncbi:MAG: hypothetical protein WB973_04935 [Thermoanaerobaculia bacterium]